MRRLHLDYETRGVVDLTAAGVYAYAEEPRTEVILAAWAIDDEPFEVWDILGGDPIPPKLAAALLDPDVILVAHNVGFERVMSTVVGRRQGFLPEPVRLAIRDPKRWSCTAARAAACGLPRALENVARVLKVEHQKDMEGHRLMMQMCRPLLVAANGTCTWAEDPVRIKRLGIYCMGDGEAERDIDHILPDLSPFEHEVWCANERMNDRGIKVDNQMLLHLTGFTRDATTLLNQKLVRLSRLQHTGDWCGIGSNNRECYQRDGDCALNENKVCTHCGGRPTVYHRTTAVPAVTNPKSIVKWLADYGIDTEGGKIGKWILQGLLEDEDLPAIVREVLLIRKNGGKSSTAKFNALTKRINLDSCIRGSLLYGGAASTLRWSSRGAQLQNLPRGGTLKKKVNAAIAAVVSHMPLPEFEKEFGPPLVAASELIRPMFCAEEGCWLARGDYAQIEDRVNALLSGEKKTLRDFAKYDNILGWKDVDGERKPVREGPDLYIVAASQALRISVDAVDDLKRQTGKVIRLACGFGGGVGAISSMCRIYNVKMTGKEKEEAKENFRGANPNVKSFWHDLDATAIKCMQSSPGTVHPVRNGIFFKRNSYALIMRLPSGRNLCYWYPRLEMVDTPWGEKRLAVVFMAEDSQKKIWCKHKGYGGLWCENAVQATARDIMAYAIVNLERAGYKPVLTVHDEAVCQLSKAQFPTAKEAAEAVRKIMMRHPPWLPDWFPLSADASASERYQKG